MALEVKDLRSVPMESLTMQELQGRKHLVRDALRELRLQLAETQRIAEALDAEIAIR